MPENRRIANDAPVLAFNYEPEGQLIWPCLDCFPCHLEAVQTEEEALIVREWHAVDGAFMFVVRNSCQACPDLVASPSI
jgi:hypothetical protein